MIPFILAPIMLLILFALAQWLSDRRMHKTTAEVNAKQDAKEAEQDLRDLPRYNTVEEALRCRSYVESNPRPRFPRIRITRG